ncbi:MAG: PadR family transcriptional regulator [Clostridiales bacterium]|nr:PadR family transcriptional regulator [Clostridiales bacterium]
MPTQALTEAVYYILLSLLEPLHGYGIMQRAAELSNGRVKLAAGTLYGALTTLLEKGYISSVDEDPSNRQKRYIITNTGREVLKNELARLHELVKNGDMLLNDEGNDS